MPPKRVQTHPSPKSSKDSPKKGGLGGLSTPRQAPIRAGDRKSYLLKPPRRTKVLRCRPNETRIATWGLGWPSPPFLGDFGPGGPPTVPGAKLGPKMAQDSPRWPKTAPRWPKMAQVGSQDGPRQSKMAQDSPKPGQEKLNGASFRLSQGTSPLQKCYFTMGKPHFWPGRVFVSWVTDGTKKAPMKYPR